MRGINIALHCIKPFFFYDTIIVRILRVSFRIIFSVGICAPLPVDLSPVAPSHVHYVHIRMKTCLNECSTVYLSYLVYSLFNFYKTKPYEDALTSYMLDYWCTYSIVHHSMSGRFCLH